MEEGDKEKTAFIIGNLDCYECNRMAFGLTHSNWHSNSCSLRFQGNLSGINCQTSWLRETYMFSDSCLKILRLSDKTM